MTPQLRLVAIGGAVALVAKFWFQKDNQTSLLLGTAAISAIAILTAHEDKDTK
jgi:hypothetical protein